MLVETYPSVPKPSNDEKRAAEEINVDGIEERYPSVPKPSNDEKRADEEIKVDGIEERYPSVPKPSNELVNCGVEIMLDKFVIAVDRQPNVPRPCIVEFRPRVVTSPIIPPPDPLALIRIVFVPSTLEVNETPVPATSIVEL